MSASHHIRKKLHQSDYQIRKLVRAQYEKSLKDKLAKENKSLKREQQGLKDFVVYRKDSRKIIDRKDWVKTDDDSPLLAVQGGVLFNNLKKNWIGYKIGKNKDGRDKEYAVKVQSIQKKIGYNVTEFDIED